MFVRIVLRHRAYRATKLVEISYRKFDLFLDVLKEDDREPMRVFAVFGDMVSLRVVFESVCYFIYKIVHLRIRSSVSLF